MTGKSNWLHSRTQGLSHCCFCRWLDVLWLLRELSLPSDGWCLGQGHGFSTSLTSMLLWDAIWNWQCIWTECVYSFKTIYFYNFIWELGIVITLYLNSDVLKTMCELLCNMWMVLAKLYDLGDDVGKVWNPSWFHGLPGLYGFKYANSSASAGVFILELL
jgi:hypothetical protein